MKRVFKRKSVIVGIIAIVALYIIWFFWVASPFFSLMARPFSLVFGEKNYLVVFQNNYELRPTGGFISSFGILTFKHGIPTSFGFEDVYGTVDDHPRVDPPYPLNKLLAHPTYMGHTFRDANVDPDFPTTAVELERFLHMTRPTQKIDGVFAVDLTFIENWLSEVSSVSVNGVEFNADNLAEQIENSVRDVDFHDLQALADRKNGMKNLARRIVLKAMLPWNTAGFFRALEKSFNEKHALAFFKDPVLQDIVVKKNWGGVLEPKAGEDFLAVVDSNYGAGKSNRYVKRNVFYNIDLERGVSYLDVRYDNPGDYNVPLSTDYAGYVRAFVPADHEIKNAEFAGKEGGLYYAGQTFKVPVLSNGTVHFDFDFPKPALESFTYNLNLWKQPGVKGDYYEVTVRVPNGMRMKSADFVVTENIATYRGFLTQDKRFSFILEKDLTPPRTLLQEIPELNMFQVDWNESVTPSSLNPEEWSIEDADVKNPHTDNIKIESAHIDGIHLYIRATGMTIQPEERYTLEIVGIGDYRGNRTGKKTYTFVQRLK